MGTILIINICVIFAIIVSMIIFNKKITSPFWVKIIFYAILIILLGMNLLCMLIDLPRVLNETFNPEHPFTPNGIILFFDICSIIAISACVIVFHKYISSCMGLKIIYGLCFIGLVGGHIYTIYNGIENPITYEEQRVARFQTTVDQLIAIRTAQVAYKENVLSPVYTKDSVKNGKKVIKEVNGNDTIFVKSKVPTYEHLYTPSFDELINFINNGNLKVVRAIGTLTDEQMKKGLTEKKAVDMIAKAKKTGNWKEVEENGLKNFKRDTILVPVKDSLFKHLEYPVEDIRYTRVGRKVEFKMDTATVMTGSGVAVKVFQCYALYDDLLDGLDRQLTVNYKDKIKDTCLRVGKLDEANNNAGNWDATMEKKKQE